MVTTEIWEDPEKMRQLQNCQMEFARLVQYADMGSRRRQANEMNKKIAELIRKRTEQLNMPRPKGYPKTGGRKKGTPNKCRKSIDYFAEKVFKQVDMIQKGIELLEHKDPRVQSMVWCRLMDYKFGRPREQLVISGSLDVKGIIEQARDRVLRAYNDGKLPSDVKPLPMLHLSGSHTLETPTNQDSAQVIDSNQH